MADNKTKTYVFAGHDHNQAFLELVSAMVDRSLQEDSDVVVLWPLKGESIADLAAAIEPPANVILAAHGDTDGTFTWNEDESVDYKSFLKSLPREGIRSVTIAGCYGETVMDSLLDVPSGTIIQSLVGDKVTGFSGNTGAFGIELAQLPEITPLSILLKALDNTDPILLQKWADENNAKIDADPQMAEREGMVRVEANANDVLPHTIGIGGYPPRELNLDEQVHRITADAREGMLNEAQFQMATDLVCTHYNTDAGDGPAESEDELQRTIHSVADRMKYGYEPSAFTLEEKRIAYGLAIAHLQTSGQMQEMIATAQASDIHKDGTRVGQAIAVISQWDGMGSETLARIQAIAEKVFGHGTDAGGAQDNRVTGQMNHETQVMFDRLTTYYRDKIPEGASIDDTQMLNYMMHDTQLLQSFAKLRTTSVSEITDVVLHRVPPLPTPTTSEPQR